LPRRNESYGIMGSMFSVRTSSPKELHHAVAVLLCTLGKP
jgi:hypothetical protein